MEDCHRVFVQMMMAKQLVTEDEAAQAMDNILEKLSGWYLAVITSRNNVTSEVYLQCIVRPPRGGLTGFLNVINSNLRTVSMEIGKGASEDDGTIYYAFVRLPGCDWFNSLILVCFIYLIFQCNY